MPYQEKVENHEAGEAQSLSFVLWQSRVPAMPRVWKEVQELEELPSPAGRMAVLKESAQRAEGG